MPSVQTVRKRTLFYCVLALRKFILLPTDPNYLMANERMNLMNMAKLSIKGLIESALNLGRTLDSDYAPLQQFFVVMEHCLKHGLKGGLWARCSVQPVLRNAVQERKLFPWRQRVKIWVNSVNGLGMVAHIFNPSTQEAGAGRFLWGQTSLSIDQVAC
jgi:hypothetical protein